MAFFGNLFGAPKLSTELARQKLRSLPVAKAALFYLLRPFLNFPNPKGANIDYQSNLALFEMSHLVLRKLDWSLIRSKPLVAELKEEHLKVFSEYLGLDPNALRSVVAKRGEMYSDLGSRLTYDDLHKAFSYAVHKVIKENNPAVNVTATVKSTLLAESDAGVDIFIESPVLIESAAFAMGLVWEKAFIPAYEEFEGLARIDCLYGHLRSID
jgi:hypothetical protein